MEYKNRVRGKKNQSIGSTFEDALEVMAVRAKILAQNNPTSCITTKRAIIRIKSNLDYTLIDNGSVAFIDCKCFQENYFTYSQIDDKQLKLALRYIQHGVESGFVVWFRKSDQVYYYKASLLSTMGPGSRFNTQGILLGQFNSFDLKPILMKNKPI